MHLRKIIFILLNLSAYILQHPVTVKAIQTAVVVVLLLRTIVAAKLSTVNVTQIVFITEIFVLMFLSLEAALVGNTAFMTFFTEQHMLTHPFIQE